MARQSRPASHHLTYLQAAAGSARRWSLFSLLRGAEARAAHLPRVGRARLPAQNVADLAHAGDLLFPGSTLDAIEPAHGGRMRIRARFLGLTGAMGALPHQFTEIARLEPRASPRPFTRFLDLLTDRFLQFFYRAWADAQPVAHADRPQDDRFARYLAALSGAAEGAAPRAALPQTARLHYAGLFISRRGASAVQDGMSHLLRTPVRVQEFVARWRDIEAEDRTLVGRNGMFNRLGLDAVLGGRVRAIDDSFRVLVRSACMTGYRELLPGGGRHTFAAEALDALAPTHLEWEMQLEIDERAADPARLDGQAQLGWSSWVLTDRCKRLRADARLRQPIRAVRHQTKNKQGEPAHG